MINLTTEEIIQTLKLAPHPEGGYFRETYRAGGTIGELSTGQHDGLPHLTLLPSTTC